MALIRELEASIIDDAEIESTEESNIREEINFVETDAEYLASNMISDFEEFTGEKLYNGDERRIFLQGFAYVLTDIMVHINEAGRENLLEYAIGNKLDALGDLYGNKRLSPTRAKTTLKFSLSTVPENDVIVPKGTRVTSDGSVFFATDEKIIFPEKNMTLEREVRATATETGSSYNDIQIGELSNLVDGISFVSKVTNTTVSSGGSDTESDEDYKERLRISPFAFSVAGPANAYRMIAVSVSSDVGDVSVYSPSAGVVEIAVVKSGGIIPTAEDELLKEILEACDDKERRPLTDKVQVVPATASNTTIKADYYVANDDISKIANITKAVEEYKVWQTEKIGRDINPDYLKKLMMNAGAAKVDIISPVYKKLTEKEIVQITDTSVTYKGSINV